MHLLRACQILSLPALVFLFASGARADPVAVRAESQTLSVDCASGDAEVGGNRNTVTFTGACRSLTLRGDANHIAIELASGARLDIEGNGNTIRYSIAGGGREPAVRVSGSNTDLSSVGVTPAPAPSADPLRLTGDNQRLELDCTGRPVDIQGNRSRYRLRGGCRSLSVHGEANAVQAELQPNAKVEIEGNGTNLSYSMPAGGEADIAVRGVDSHAIRVGGLETAPAPAAPPPPAIALAPAPASPPPTPPAAPAAGSAGVPQLMHDLQAQIVANGTLVTFPAETLFDGGGSLRDGAAGPLAKLAALILQIHPSGLRITATDPADADLARQRAHSVETWLSGPGKVQLKTQSDGARGTPPHVDVLILR